MHQTIQTIKFSDYSDEISNNLIRWQKATNSYYNINPSIIDMDDELTDAEFDELTNKLKLVGIQYPEILTFISGTITKGNEQVIVDETTEQISLDKIQYESIASVPKIHRWFNGALSEKECYIGPKFDGHSIKIVFDNNSGFRTVKQILTRGGQDVTEYLHDHPDVTKLLISSELTIIHGELVLPKSIFYAKWDNLILENGYANPRNAVGGVLKREPKDLKFIACTDGKNPILDATDGKNQFWQKVDSSTNFFDFYQKYKSDDYDIQIDGIVIGYNVVERIVKDNYPMNMVSVKFPAPTAKTKVIGFEWSQKKSGNLTPMYILEPVELDGSICSRANAYNYEAVKNDRCGIGSEVIITKSNDIIPIIKKVLTKSNNVVYPSVEYTVIGKHAVAIDDTLSIEYRFVLGLKLLEIDGIGETIANQIGPVVNYNIIELFNPEHKADIRLVLGGGKTYDKFTSIYNIKNLPLDQMIEMMQFNRCGKILARKFAELITGKKIDTKGIDKTLLLHICKNDGFQLIKKSISILSGFGVKVIKPVEINEDTITFEMTGTPPDGMTKKEFIDRFKVKYPNSTNTTLNKNTKYLFVDSLTSTSSKMNKARKYSISIYTYEQALKLEVLK